MTTTTPNTIDANTLPDGTIEFLCPSQVRITVAPSHDPRQKPWVQVDHAGGNVISTYANLLYMSDIGHLTQHCGSKVDAVAWHAILTDVGFRLSQIPSPSVDVWKLAVTAADFITQAGQHHMAADIRDFVIPGCITLIAAPRSSGKTIITLAVALALATGGMFRGESIPKRRVCYVDRDNPPALLRRHIQALGGETAHDLHVLTRTHAPSLLDRAAWDAFPVTDYDVVVVDSIGSATEGVSEKEGAESQRVIATLKDLAHRGPAVVGLDNTIKSGLSYRGRGEKADAVDILYEARNVTGWTPSAAAQWWEQLPDAGEHAWQQRASRRKGQTELRVAFVPSKYRLDIEPEPFVLAVATQQIPWTVADITAEIEQAGEEAATSARKAKQAKMASAEAKLIAAIGDRGPANPMTQTEAVSMLTALGLSRHEARTLVQRGGNRDLYPDGSWVLRQIPGHRSGQALGLYQVSPTPAPHVAYTAALAPDAPGVHTNSRREDRPVTDGSSASGNRCPSSIPVKNKDLNGATAPKTTMLGAATGPIDLPQQHGASHGGQKRNPDLTASPAMQGLTDEDIPF